MKPYLSPIFLPILIGFLLLSQQVFGQIIIQPPVLGNDVGPYQILELNLINNTPTTFNAHIFYEITYGETSPNKLTASGTTSPFTIPPAGLSINVSNVQTILFPISAIVKPPSDFSDYLIKNAKFPDGYYRICIKIFEELTKNEIGNICYEFKVENLTSIFLVSPFNKDIVNNQFQLFSWTAITQIPNPEYEIILIEVLKGQSLIQAEKSNNIFYTQQANSNITQLSFGTRTMTDQSTYLWYVRIMKDNIEIARSELWSFKYEANPQINTENIESPKSDLVPIPIVIPIEKFANAPALKFPKNNVTIKPKDIDTVVFNWIHEKSVIKGSIIYEFRIYVKDDAKENNDSLIYAVKKKDVLKLVLPKTLKLKEGKRYKWEVLASGNRGLKPCKNGCSSAAYTFSLGLSPTTLQYHNATSNTKTNVVEVKNELNFTCCGTIIIHDGISLSVLNQNREEVLKVDSINVKDTNESLTKMATNKYSLLLNNLKPGEPYLLKVGREPSYEYIKFTIPKK